MSLRERLLAPCGTQDLQTEAVTLDHSALLTRLLLFDSYILDSFGLKELPELVSLFGYHGIREILGEAALRFHPYRLFSGYVERSAADLPGDQMRYSLVFNGPPPARPFSYEITHVKVGTPRDEFHEYLQIAHEIPGLRNKQAIKLKADVAERLIAIPDDYGAASTAQTHQDLDQDVGGLRRAIARNLSVAHQTLIQPNEVEVAVRREGEIAIFVESNLTTRFHLTAEDAHRVIGESLLALARLNARLEDMRLCSAVSGTRPEEAVFVEEKFAFLTREVAPEAQVDRMQRVVEILGLPSLSRAVEEGRLDAEAFVKLRNSAEAVAFRSWLRNIDDLDESEMKERVESLRAMMGSALHRGGGKTVRLLVLTGVGMIPVAGAIAGLTLGALDSFLLDRALPESGPVAFLSEMYPSVFYDEPRS